MIISVNRFLGLTINLTIDVPGATLEKQSSSDCLCAVTYEPLHHKYRPQTFAQLVGQEAIAQTLSNALNRNKIAPAYLFTGPRGTGKTSSARILAKSLNCIEAEGPTASPCGQCQVCVSITKGASLDVMEMDAASHTGVDNIREIIERSQFAPVQCRYKVYAIDECHMLSTAAFNSLLKTLEEPPDRVVFVLATTDPQRVLPTIISRCQRFDFRRIPLEAMVKHLSYITLEEAIAITDEALRLVAQMSQGGLRDAESLLDQLSLLVGSEGLTEVSSEQVWDLVGSVPERDLLQLLQAIAQKQVPNILDLTKTILDRGREPLTLLLNFTQFYRDLLIAKTAPQRQDLVALTPATWQALCQLANQFSLSQILAAQTHLKESESQLKNSTQPRLWLEVSLLGLLSATLPPQQPTPAPTPASAPTINPSPQPSVSPSKAPVTPPPQPSPQTSTQAPVESSVEPSIQSVEPDIQPPAPVTSPQSGDLTGDLNNIWQAVIANLELPGTKVLISKHCNLLKLHDRAAAVGVNKKGAQGLVKGVQPQLQEAFKKTLDYPVSIKFQLIDPNVKSNVKTNVKINNFIEAHNSENGTTKRTTEVQKNEARSPSISPPPSSVGDRESDRQKEAVQVRQVAENIAQYFNAKIIENLPSELHESLTTKTEDQPTDENVGDPPELPF